MKKVHITASNEYDVIIGKGILENSGNLIGEVLPKGKTVIVSDDKVYSIYGETVKKSLENNGFSVETFTFPNGEASKNISTYTEILEFLAKKGLTRSDFLVALGGGVCGDMAGFSAATYLRGIKFVQIPTTFLAAIDSSVGGKTGVNPGAGKNLVGAFHQPALVICDTDTFKTLDEKTFADGTSEAIKYGMIKEPVLLEKLAGDFDIDEVVEICVKIKRDVVAKDEFEHGERKLLNFGHTLGHAVESVSNYQISHGKAVAIGMAMISRAAEYLSICSSEACGQILTILNQFGLPCSVAFSVDELLAAACSDKKRSGGSINLIVPQAIGNCLIRPTPIFEFRSFIEAGF